MNRSIRIAAALAACAPVALVAADLPSGPYVTQSMIEQGAVSFSLPALGTFAIEAIERPADAAQECHVSLRAVASSIESSIATGELELKAGKKRTVWLKKFVFGDGHILCDTPGSECKVKVKVTSTVDIPEVQPL